jgi:hypothetical protein
MTKTLLTGPQIRLLERLAQSPEGYNPYASPGRGEWVAWRGLDSKGYSVMDGGRWHITAEGCKALEGLRSRSDDDPKTPSLRQ